MQQAGFLLCPLLLGSQMATFSCVLTWSTQVSMSYLCPDVLLRTRSYCTKATRRTSFYLNYHFKGPTQIHSHFKVLGVKTTTYSCCCYLAAQSCLTLCDPMDCSPPGSSVHGISQPRILEWLPCPSPGDLPNPGIKPMSPAWQEDSLPLHYLGSPTTHS